MNHAEAHRHLSASDKRLAGLISRSHRYNIEPNLKVRPFDALAESIAYQQLSGKAAATIWKRVRAIFPKRKFLDPKLVWKRRMKNYGRRFVAQQSSGLKRSRRQNNRRHRANGPCLGQND